MRHGRKGYKLGRTHAHRQATLAALSNALIKHKRISTTLSKAKALRIYVEPLITRSKDDTTHNRRQVFRYLQNKESVTELFGEIAGRVAERHGGYTRVVKLGQRTGDGAELAVIELVDFNESEPETTGRRRRRTRRGAGRSRRRGKGEAAAAAAAPVATAEDEAVEEAGIEVIDTAVEVVEEAVDAAVETVEEAVDAAVEVVEEAVDAAKETIEEAVEALEEDAEEATAEAAGAAAEVVEETVEETPEAEAAPADEAEAEPPDAPEDLTDEEEKKEE